MHSQLEQVLMDTGPCLSSVAAVEMQRRYGLTAVVARKRISRAEHPVKRLDLQFRRGAAFIYLATQYQTQRFFRALADALEANNGAYARVVQAIGARGGIMPLAHLQSAAGLADVDGQLGVREVVARLVKAGVITEIELGGLGVCVAFDVTVSLDEPIQRMKARLVAEGVLLEAVKQWARNLALGSYELFNLRGGDKPPTVSRFQWDMTAPSYLSGLSAWDAQAKKLKPGFLVADVLLGLGAVDERALRPFIYKCETLRHTKVGRCMQFFLAEGFSNEALMQLRKNGVIPGRVEELFGLEVAKSLKELVATLTQTAAAAIDPAKFDLLFSSLGRFGAAAGRLRGALFEFFAAALLQEDGWHDVVLNKVYREGGKDLAEVDVRARRGEEVLFVECKGIAPGTVLEDDEVERWLDTRVPAIARRARQNEEHANFDLKFELWTTGELSAKSRALIEKRQKTVRPTKYTLEVRQGPQLKKMAVKHKRGQPALLEVLEQHFLSSPLSEAKELASNKAKPAAIDDVRTKRPNRDTELMDEAADTHKVARKVPRRAKLRDNSAVFGSAPHEEELPN